MFFGDGNTVGYVNFDGLYYLGQWIGFWCAIAGLALFGLAAWQHRFSLLSFRVLAPAIAVGLPGSVQRGSLGENRGGRARLHRNQAPDSSYFRYRIEDRHGVGYHLYRAGMLRGRFFRDLPEGRYALLTYSCNGRDAAFMVLAPRR